MKYQPHSATSYAAAVEIEVGADTLRGQVFRFLRCQGRHGATDEEMQTQLYMNPSTQRPRRVELVAMRMAEDSGRQRKTVSGRMAVVWVCCRHRPERVQGELF